MRINSRVLLERTDLFQDLFVKDCPSEIAKEANNLLNMAVAVGYSLPKSYNTMTELYKKITLDYWDYYDGKFHDGEFREWFIKSTSSSNIERACRWLIQHNYFIDVKEDVLERREKAASNFRNSVRG